VVYFEDDEETDEFDRTASIRRTPTLSGEPLVDKRSTERRQGNARILMITIIVVAVLHLARPVVVPIALAVLFAFLLTPIVRVLERTFLRRSGAIVLSLGIAVAGCRSVDGGSTSS
jgi:hypothetical protein